MMPYPEPYQSAYQRRRLGALGIEWRPSSVKFAIGTDIGLGPELLPLADLDAVIEPLPEFVEAMYWDFDNEVVRDDTDSEYDISEELSSEGERKKSLPSRSPSDSACSSEDDMVEEDGLRRSKRRKDKSEVKLMTSSGRRLKRSNRDEGCGASSRSKRAKRRMNVRTTFKRKSIKEKSLRSQRAAARNALTLFSQIDGPSSDEDCKSLEDDLSESETMSQNSDLESKELDSNLLDEEMEDSKAKPTSLHMAEKIGPPKRLVLKFSIRDKKKSETSKRTPLIDNQADLESELYSPSHDTSKRVGAIYISNDSYSANASDMGVEISENSRTESYDKTPIKVEGHLDTSVECKRPKIRLTTVQIKSEDHTAKDASNDYLQNIEVDADDVLKSSLSDDSRHDLVVDTNYPDELNESSPHRPTKIRIRSKKNLSDLECPSKLEFRTPVDILSNDADDVKSTGPPCVEDGGASSSLWRSPSNSNRKMAEGSRIKIKFKTSKGNKEGFRQDQRASTSKVDGFNHDSESDSPEIASGGSRRTRSMRLNPTSREKEKEKRNFRPRRDLKSEDTSDVWMSSSRPKTRSRSTKNRGGLYPTEDFSNTPPDWLLLPRQEDCYRYIPQLGDEVIYLRQGHQEYLESVNRLDSGPWCLVKGHIRAVEFCSIKSLKYSTLPGSGESCCKLTLKFIDPSSAVLGGVFRLTLSELNNFPDFLVERTRYEAAILRNWTARDKCLVWWREDRGQSGNWWEGRILSSKDKSNEFPGSPWERYLVQYKSDPTNTHQHSPWELHDLEISWEHPHIDDEFKNELLSAFGYLAHSVKIEEKYGTSRLNQIALKLDFQNRFPVPLSPALIESRLKNRYYRSLVAVKHDINVMLSNALIYFDKNAEFTEKIRRLSELFSNTFSDLEVDD